MDSHSEHLLSDDHNESNLGINVDQPIESIDSMFKDLKQIILNSINSLKLQRAASDDSDDDFLSGLNRSLAGEKNLGSNLQARTYKLKQALNQYYKYIWNSIQKTINLDLEGLEDLSPANYVEYFIENIMNPITELRSFLIQLLEEIALTKNANINDTIYLTISDFLDELMMQYYENVFNIYQKSTEYKSHDLPKSIIESLFYGIYNYSEAIEKTHYTLLKISRQIEIPEYEVSDIEKQYEELTNIFNEKINSHFQSFKEALNPLHAIHSKLFEKIHEIFKKYKNSDESFSTFESGILYPRCEGFSNICNVEHFSTPPLSIFSNDNEDLKSKKKLKPEKIWHNLCKKQFNRFVMNDIQLSGNELQKNLFDLWSIVHKYNLFDDSISIGSMLYNVFDNRSEIHDEALKLADVSESYYLTVIYVNAKAERNENEEEEDEFEEEDELTSLQLDFGSLLEDLVTSASSTIQSLRSEQYQLLSLPPNKESQMKEYSRKAKEITNLIQEKAMDLNTALYHGREVSFILFQQTKMRQINESEQEDENLKDYLQNIDNFRFYDHEESEMIIRQLNKLTSLHTSIFDKNNTREHDRARLLGTANKGKPKLSQKTELQQRPSRYAKTKFQPTTLYSKSRNEKTPLSQSSKIMIATMMSAPEQMQINLVDDAIVSSYIQLFSSIKGTLVANIRSGDHKQALNVREEITERMAEATTYINLMKKRSKALNDIHSIKAIEKRIAMLNRMQTDDLKKCIRDSLRDVIEANMASYDLQVVNETKKYDKTRHVDAEQYHQTFKDLTENKHISDLMLIEKRKILAVYKEQQREFSRKEFDQQQIKITHYMEDNQFKEAKKEQAKLAEMQEKTRQEAISIVKKKFNRLEKEKLEEQKQELIRFRERYLLKKQRAKDSLNQQKEKLLRLLYSSIKSSSQRHFEFALQVLSGDPKTKKEMTNLLNNIVYQSLIARYQQETDEDDVPLSSSDTLDNLAKYCKYGLASENWVNPI